MNRFNKNRSISLLFISALSVVLCSCFVDDPEEPIPEPVSVPKDYLKIAAGGRHSLALSTETFFSYTTLWAWGDNTYGQVGDSTTIDRSIPIRIGFEYTAISAGGTHSLALKSPHSLLAWGDNRSGQLGDGTFSDKTMPVLIDTGYVNISAGGYHSLGLKLDGTLWAWGNNEYGQLGDGSFENRAYPVQIGSGFFAVEAGTWHSMAIRTDGSLWTWGSNEFGQLGDGSNEDRNTPVSIGSSYVTMAAGGYHSLAWKEGGTLWSWGKNEYGQLGDATNVDKNIPVFVMEVEGQWNLSLAAGAEHSLAMMPYENVWACGKNHTGQLGDGTLTNRNQWHQIEIRGIAIAAGGNHSFALKEEVEYPGGIGPFFINHLWAWGSNDAGQMGHGAIPAYTIIPLHIGPQ